MDLTNASAAVTGGASGLGRATAEAFLARGVPTVIIDLPSSNGEVVAKELGDLATFMPADVRDPEAVDAALAEAESKAPLRAVVHCAGRGGKLRVVEKDGTPGSLELYQDVISTNLVGTFNVLRLAAARMVKNDVVDGERGIIIMTASVAAFEGQIGQAAYSSSKAGVAGLTIVAARDLARKFVRVVTIAPGTFETPILGGLSDKVRESLASQVPHPSRLGAPTEYAKLALAIVDNAMINGETIRIDGAIRMGPV
ncbi:MULTISPECIES: SDR family NAD(P)-dependent oxidoreductase [Rhodococcus]|uniref:NAD(P)-dependent dehydrogenase (Short-subunit alcohol dehydrogenase family) n=1 Tax=Nocardia globerula TaxID=1818 RepID=A0A652YHC1_NOCGL|nr:MULTISPECIES: SDR family NAD(P)-dependent oxidoreductase [Rhodococcus]NMD64295.1 SDR family NAD(P)-dependent oxidoreductase [Nocardia globerula]NRI69997.1 SDR family NAD(P)-dependent oxidoreductase [Rhodococcus sp. MS16]PVX63389.1 NAD(P)-dependent dehydrogenase (short-subunit alcohol dehydrogenase family) [Rhodococcus globerulus]QXW05235.1 SDR family NAD(P)-dependent oxidoreductase [Rhodococcus globerulus]RZL21255.1 MAG: SDR family NAD(P)-dependent oxidoreductase [Rhodococcus sp. (in: high 